MRHLSAAILLALGGKTVDEQSVSAVLKAAGVKVDEARVKKVVEQVKGKDVMQLAKEGLKKMGTAAATTTAPVKEEKKETKKKEEKPKVEAPPEEEEYGMGDLF